MKLTRMNISPLDEYLQTEALRHWGCELAEAVAGVSDDQEQRHMAWRTIVGLMAGRSDQKRTFFAYIFLLQLLNSATRTATVRLAEHMRGEFMDGNPDTFMNNLDEARDKAMARIGRKQET